VAWYDDTPEADVKEAILVACDSIFDQGFTLVNSGGESVHFSQVISGERYTLAPGEEVKGYEKVLGDKWRRVTVEIEPLKHGEVVKALELLKAGSNLLKHTRGGIPHIRMFQLTNDLSSIIWYSGSNT
jgi:hypothetical protein